MRIIVSDTSCLIDLRKASLLKAFMSLPYEITIPDTLFEEELLNFSKTEKTILLGEGMNIIELPGEGVLRAKEIESEFPDLSIHDCFAFALAERNSGCVLLTGDNKLRVVATNHEIEVHGVLWAVDEIRNHGTESIQKLIAALELFEREEAIHLPVRMIRAFKKRFKELS